MSPETLDRPSLVDRLSEPATAEALHRLLDRLDSVDKVLQVAEDVPSLLAIATDFFDAIVRRASDDGIDVQQRAADLLRLVNLATEPKNLEAIEKLIGQLPKLAEGSALIDGLPDLIATAMDVFDEWATDLKADGIELEQSLRQGLRAALYLGSQIRRDELNRVGFLIKSDVLDKHSVEAVGLAGSALSSCRQGTCEHPVPKRVGLFGLLSALRDPNTQRALSFGLQFAKCFGNALDQNHGRSGLSDPPKSSS